jgi:hypothetical protein
MSWWLSTILLFRSKLEKPKNYRLRNRNPLHPPLNRNNVLKCRSKIETLKNEALVLSSQNP